jgi:hypothetical protein
LKGKGETIIYGAILSALVVSTILFVGGLFHDIYVNSQEYPTTYPASLSDYLRTYVSGLIMAAVEIGAGYYFVRYYNFDKKKKIMNQLKVPLIAGLIGFLAYIFGEFLSGYSTATYRAPIQYAFYYSVMPSSLDYSNALIIGLSVFGIVLLIKSMIKINPFMVRQAALPKDSGILSSLWSTFITTASATVCCGPLPGAITLSVGIPSLYFTALITYQPIIAAVGIPILIFAILLADRRATRGCKLIDDQRNLSSDFKAEKPTA